MNEVSTSLVKNLIRHGDFIWDLVRREIRGRYAGSIMGLFWTILSPALTILILFTVFSKIMAVRLTTTGGVGDYVIYLCCSILPWNSFQETIQRSTTVFVDHSSLIMRARLPKEILVAQVVVSSILNLLVGFGLFIVIMILAGKHLGMVLFLLPVVIVSQMFFSFGIGLLFSTLNVFFRDLTQIISVILHLWFWVTPIVYPVDILPQQLKFWIKLNPLTHLMDIYRDLILYSTFPNGRQLFLFAGVSLAMVVLGSGVYKRLKDDIVDEV